MRDLCHFHCICMALIPSLFLSPSSALRGCKSCSWSLHRSPWQWRELLPHQVRVSGGSRCTLPPKHTLGPKQLHQSQPSLGNHGEMIYCAKTTYTVVSWVNTRAWALSRSAGVGGCTCIYSDIMHGDDAEYIIMWRCLCKACKLCRSIYMYDVSYLALFSCIAWL